MGVQAFGQVGPTGSSLDSPIFTPAPAEVVNWLPESHKQPLHRWLSGHTWAVPPEHALLFIAIEIGYEISKPSSSDSLLLNNSFFNLFLSHILL